MFFNEDRNKSVIKAAPASYIASEMVLKDSGKYIAKLGKRLQIIGGEKALSSLGSEFHNSLDGEGLSWQEYIFRGEVCDTQIERIKQIAQQYNADVLIGVGGGKALDAAKIAASSLSLPIVCIPTIAATCAAVTPMSVLYHEDGVYKQDVFFTTTPDMVLIDPHIIAKAPAVYLKSGMLDAVAKYYEGNASIVGSRPIADIFDDCALNIAGLLYREMNQCCEEAVRSAEKQEVSKALITAINLNIFFAGMIQSLGIKAVRNGIAHSVHNGLTVLPESHRLLHGIKVGYGIFLQVTLLDLQKELYSEAVSFFNKIHFTPSFREMGLSFTEENILAVAQKTYGDPMMRRMPFDYITCSMIADAIRAIEADSNFAKA